MEVPLESQPFDLDFHSSSSLVAAGLISARLQLFKFNDELTDSESVWSIVAHSESCRALRFAEDGRSILSASSDCSILATDVETGRAVARLNNAHGYPINRLINLGENTIASGDDDGTIKVWDTRQNTCCNSFSPHEDYISDLEFVPSTSQLLGVSGDGTLSVCNLRRNKVDACSEFSEDELLSVVLVKDGRKVVCGSQEGVLLLYSWAHFKDCSDRFIGHPKSVEAILKLNEDLILTGSSDGLIRLISILPNKMVGVVGEHTDFPIERLAFGCDKKVLGSASHDHNLKLWDVAYLLEGDDTKAMEEEDTIQAQSGAAEDHSDPEVDEDEEKGKKKKKSKKNPKSGTSTSSFFDDL